MTKKIFILLISAIISLTTYAQTDSLKLKIMSFNIQNGNACPIEELARYISMEKPDIISIQEIDFKTFRGSNAGKDILTELAAATGMFPIYGKSLDFMGGYYGIGILSRYPFISTEKMVLPKIDKQTEQRTLLTAEIEINPSKRIIFAATHLEHTAPKERVAQIEYINNWAESKKLPIVIAGDFNAEPNSIEIKKGMDSWLKLCNDTPTWPAGEAVNKIDYIFAFPKNSWIKKNSYTPSIKISDHQPLISEAILIFK